MPNEFTFEEATQPTEFGWEDVAPEPAPSKASFPFAPFAGAGEVGAMPPGIEFQPLRFPRVGFTPQPDDTEAAPRIFGVPESITSSMTKGGTRKAAAIIANAAETIGEMTADPMTPGIVVAATAAPEVMIPYFTATMAKSGSTKLAEGITDLEQGRESEGVAKIGESAPELFFAGAPALHPSGFAGRPTIQFPESLRALAQEPAAPIQPLRPFMPGRVQPGERAGAIIPTAGEFIGRPGLPTQPKPPPVEVPGTMAEPRENVIEAIRKADARTIAKIQGLFPEAKLSREQARVFRNIAFPPVAEPVRPQATVADILGKPPEEPPAPGGVAVPKQPPAPTGGPENAIREPQAAKVYEPLSPQSIEGQEALPSAQGGVRVPTPQEAQPKVPLDLAGNPAEFYSLPRLRALDARNDPRVAAAKRYYGARTIPDLARLAKARFEAMAKPPTAPAPAEAPKPAPPSPEEQAAIRAQLEAEEPGISTVGKPTVQTVEPEFQTVEVGRFKDEMAASRMVDENVNHRSYRKSGDDYVVYEDRPTTAQPTAVLSGPKLNKAYRDRFDALDEQARADAFGEMGFEADPGESRIFETDRDNKRDYLRGEQLEDAKREFLRLTEPTAVPATKPVPEPPATAVTEKPWYESGGEPMKQRVFAAMRKLRERADAAAERERALRAPHGTIAAGAAGFDEFVRSEAQSQVLSALNNGKTPAEAEAAAKAWAREAVAIHNRQRPRDVNWQRDEGTADSTIETARRQIEDAAKEPAPPEPPTRPETPAVPPGPGAASPREFAERTARGAGAAPPEPPVAVDASAKPTPETVRQAKDFNIFNLANSGQWSFYFGKLGQAAKSAWDRMAMAGFRIREETKRDTERYVKNLLTSLPLNVRKGGGKVFFDVLDGKTMDKIEAEWAGNPNGQAVIDAAQQIKSRLEDIRMTILDTKRESYHGFLMSLDRPTLSQLFDANISRAVDTSKYSKEQFADALTRAELPDDWGISDGSYLPHIFFGNWKVTAQRGATPEFVTRARTPAEAKAKIFEYTKANPDFVNAQWKIEPDTVVPADILRLADRRFWHLISQMKDALNVSASDIKQAQQGVIGKKSSKQKWFGNLQKREGFRGYERDYEKVMSAYLSGFHRWVELSKLQREVQPLIEQVRGGRTDEFGNRVEGGRPRAAEQLDDIMDYMWGKPARSTLLLDSLIQRIPFLRDRMKPLLLDRLSQWFRTVAPYLTLKTLRFAVVNRLQPLQGLYPLVGERILAQSKIAQHTPEGRALLDEAGVRFDPGQYGIERGITGKAAALGERFTGERSNQELAFLAMFQHGTESGLSRGEAINYAKLRGQLLTQFTPNPADIPPIMRGPFTSVLFQFKRFPIKQAELMTKMGAQGKFGGLARWFTVMAATGGLSYFLKQLWAPADTRERIRRAITSEYGQTVADGVMYGLPGLVNVDLSGSLVIGDEPFGSNLYEKVGRSVIGPGVGLAYDTASSILTAAREPTTPTQDALTLLRKFPSTKPIAELIALANSDLDVRTPDGEVKYRKAVKDAIVGLGSFKTASESNLQSAVNGWIAIEKEATSLKNAAFVELMKHGGNADKALEAIHKFNDRWPERAITGSELNQYIHDRAKRMGKTDYERAVGKRGAVFLTAQP